MKNYTFLFGNWALWRGLRKHNNDNLRNENGVKREMILRMTWSDGKKYEGQFSRLDGRREGTGVERWKNGNVYEGHFNNDMRNG